MAPCPYLLDVLVLPDYLLAFGRLELTPGSGYRYYQIANAVKDVAPLAGLSTQACFDHWATP